MTEAERIELAAVALRYSVFLMDDVLRLRSSWAEFSDTDPRAEVIRAQAIAALDNARTMKRNGVMTSWDWLINA